MHTRYFARIILLFFTLFMLIPAALAHGDSSEAMPFAGRLSWGFMLFGILVIVAVSTILFTRGSVGRSAEAFERQHGLGGYIARMRMFSTNARLYMVHVVGMDVIYGTWEVIFNLYLLAVGFSITFVGLRILVRSISAALMAIPSGIISDRIGRKLSFILGDGMGAVMALIAISTTNETVILVTALISGIFGSLHGVSEPAFMAENSENYERIHLFSVADGTRTAAAIIGSALAGLVPMLLAEGDPNKLVTMYRLVAYFGILIWFASLIPAVLLKQMAAPASGSLSLRGVFSNVKHPDLVFKLSLPAAFIGLGAGFALPLMNVWFKENLGSSDVEIGATFAAGQALLVAASFMAPFIAMRLGKVRAIMMSQAASVPFIFLLGYAPEAGKLFGSVIFVAVLAYVVRVSTMNVSGPIRSAFGMEILDPAERGTQVGVERALVAGLSGVSGYAGAQLMNSGDFRTPFMLMAGSYLVAIALFWVFFGREKQKYPLPGIAGQGAD